MTETKETYNGKVPEYTKRAILKYYHKQLLQLMRILELNILKKVEHIIKIIVICAE